MRRVPSTVVHRRPIPRRRRPCRPLRRLAPPPPPRPPRAAGSGIRLAITDQHNHKRAFPVFSHFVILYALRYGPAAFTYGGTSHRIASGVGRIPSSRHRLNTTDDGRRAPPLFFVFLHRFHRSRDVTWHATLAWDAWDACVATWITAIIAHPTAHRIREARSSLAPLRRSAAHGTEVLIRSTIQHKLPLWVRLRILAKWGLDCVLH